jgi:general secretion pathway protein D
MKNNNIILLKVLFALLLFLFDTCVCDGLVSIQFHGKKLDDLLQKIAEIKNINIFLPQEIIKNEVLINFSTPHEVPLEELEEYLLYFLSMSGYVLSLQDGVFVVNKKHDDHLRRYPLPLYVDVSPADLPDNPGYIRAMYFLKNLRVQGSQSIAKILLDIMPEREKDVIIDPRSNCIIVTGPANAIAASMSIILEIDQYGIEDEVAFVPLKHSSVGYVAKLLEDLINLSKDPSGGGQQQVVPYNGATYFSPQIKIVQSLRHNALIILGKKNAIETVISFVESEIDIPQSSGDSLIHVYNLKYLDARKIAPIMQSIVSGRTQSGQSVKEAGGDGNYRSFDGVRILAEEIAPANSQGGDSKGGSKLNLGGNRLIIAATRDDYAVIEGILKEIDQPQLQVVIEMMILDLEISEDNNFSSQLRIPQIFNLPNGVQFQSVMMDNSLFVLNDPSNPSVAITDPNNIKPTSTANSDLLSKIGGSNSGEGDVGGGSISSIADSAPRRGMLISLGERFKNASISAILQLDQSILKRNVIASPYAVTQNNMKAEFKAVQIRRGEGSIDPANTQYGGATVVKIQPYDAALGVRVTPRVSRGRGDLSGDEIKRLNLEIEVDIEDFKSSSDSSFDKLTRRVKTNANMTSGDLLIVGGLHKESHGRSQSKVPFLGDIPILGALFRKSVKSVSNTNLVVIVRPTIVEKGTMKTFTNKKTRDFMDGELDEMAFSKLDGSVARFYFDTETGNFTTISNIIKDEASEDKYYDDKYKQIERMYRAI